MSDTLTPLQINAINSMSAEQRYDHCLRQIVALKQLWGLASSEGWVIMPEGGEEHFPLWSHAQLAQQWAAGEFADCQPQAIALEEWLEKWLPGMAGDNLLAAVSPNQEGEAIVVEADELLEELQALLAEETGAE